MKNNIKKILKGDADFPLLLKEIPGSPEKIFVRGDLKEWPKKAVAIVGTRKATQLGLKIAEEFAMKLVRAGFTIVSGLALGIDTASHRGALKAGGKTMAVLGCGADKTYPAQNENLASEIIYAGGAIISEYEPGTPTYPNQFIERNRIISGLSLATIVIEAPIRSGAISTAGFAGAQGRAVFAVPGPINHPNYRGSHALIRDGVTLVTSVEEVLEELGFETGEPSAENIINIQNNEILSVLKDAGRPLALDEIIEMTGMGTGETTAMLATLSIDKKVIETPSGYTLGR